MNHDKTVSVVLCTYNGAEHLRQQLDTVLAQTYPLHEVIVQDDGSIDATPHILRQYAARHPSLRIHANEASRGINGNFFSAMARATGDYIALCDQDDLWEPTKIEEQMAAIGQAMLCTCRSVPFSDDPSLTLEYDHRCPNHGLIRLMYSSLPGHTMLLRRDLLALIPAEGEIYQRTYYDVIIGITAAAYDSIVMVDRPLVRQRRARQAASYVESDPRRHRSTANGLYMLRYALAHYAHLKRCVMWHFEPRLRFLQAIQAPTEVRRDCLLLLQCECRRGPLALLRFAMICLKHRHTMFYTYERDPAAIVRALLHPVMHLYSYRYLMDKVD